MSLTVATNSRNGTTAQEREYRLTAVVTKMRNEAAQSARAAERDRRIARKGIEELRAKRA